MLIFSRADILTDCNRHLRQVPVPQGSVFCQEQEGNSCSETESESDDEYNPEEPSSDEEGAKDGDESSEDEDGEEEEEDRPKKVSKK